MNRAAFDARHFKALERAGFNRIAARYAQGAGMRSVLADMLLRAAGLEPGQRVLDLASGPGLLACEAARRVQPAGLVLASDIAEGMLAEGRARANVECAPAVSACLLYAAADAEQLCLPDASFDTVLAGLALFMFPHPEHALQEMRRALRPGGMLALSVWGAREAVPLIHCAQDCIARLLPQPKVARPSVFRFGDAGALEGVLAGAGFSEIRIEPCRWSCHFDDAASYWQAFLDLAGGAAEALSRLAPDLQLRLRAAVAHELEGHRSEAGQGYALEALALIATARA